MFDVFYSGRKPGLFAHEHEADSIEHAQQLSRTRYFWWVNYLTDYTDWDFLWEPVPWQSHQRHAWPSQWQKDSGTYLVPKAWDGAETNYRYDAKVVRVVDFSNWQIPNNLDKEQFDFSWHPDPTDPEPFKYHFASQHQQSSGLIYAEPGAVLDKFVDFPTVTMLPYKQHWEICEAIDNNAWDWSWHPDATDPPLIYVFGNQWNPPEFKASLKYAVPGATEVKYMDQRTKRLPQKQLFEFKIAVAKFDYSWEPNPFDPPYIYVFGNTWYPAEQEPSVVYTVPGATEVKYINDIVATPWGSMADYELLYDIEEDKFDWTWHPDPNDPPYIYVFGNQWYSAEIMPTLKYHQPGAKEIKYMDAPRATLPQRHNNRWHTIEDCEWDYSWVPDPGDPPYIYVFGNQWWPAEVMPTVRYTVPGALETKYMHEPKAQLLENCRTNYRILTNCDFDFSWCPDPGDPPYIYVFGNQWWSAEVMPSVEYHAFGATERKYVDWPRATMRPDQTLWTIPEGVNPDTVDFSWVPDPGEPPYIYQFATQHQKTGGPVYTVPGATETKYLEHLEIKIEVETVPIVEIDHMDGNAGYIPGTIKKIRYFDNYRDTLIRLAKSLKGEHEFVWVCSSICDYSNFDFTWHPEKWQSTMLHVFASDEQKFGDTFYMHVPTFTERAEKKALLEWYSVNYVPRKRVPRRPIPVVRHDLDSQVDAVKTRDFPGPLALFTNTDYVDRSLTTVPLWREEVKTIIPIAKGATSVIVPKAAVPYVKTQLYDYPNIDKTKVTLKSKPLDIVFISNGENDAEYLYNRLEGCIKDLQPNRLVRVENVKGRVAAYQAAARASNTSWFFAVFGKLEIDLQFPWDWQPDRMQQPKHYIFHAHNPINDLTYGHQAMIAYNKKLVLENTGQGLDFTLDQEHEVVPILSGTANYHTSDWMCWRTAFREALKLRASLPDVENEYRLEQWLTKDWGTGRWSTKGAQDAVEYYESVGGDFAELKKSYEWDWLASYAFLKRGLSPNQ